MPETLTDFYRQARRALERCGAWADTSRLTLALWSAGGLPRCVLEDLIAACQAHHEEGPARLATHALVRAWRMTPASGEHHEQEDRSRRLSPEEAAR